MLIFLYNNINNIRTNLINWYGNSLGDSIEYRKNRRAGIYKVLSIKEYSNKNNLCYRTIDIKRSRKIFIAPYYEEENKMIIKEFISPEIYTIEFNNVSVIGENSVIIADKNICLYDMAASDVDKRYDLRFGGIKNIDKNTAIIETINSNQEITEGISLNGFASYNYYHLLVELLSRMIYIDKFPEYNNIPIIVDECVMNVPQYQEMLNIVNKGKHEIIFIKRFYEYHVNKLVYFSYNSWLPINLKKRSDQKGCDFMMDEVALQQIRKRVTEYFNIDIATCKGIEKIFISRKNTKNRRLVNEEKVIELAKTHGFDVVFPEELELSEQIKIFSQAQIVLGATGAGFTNIMFCPPNVKIMCITPKDYKYYGYATLAGLLKLEFRFIDAKVLKKERVTSMECYKIDIDYLKRVIKDI